MQSYLSQTVLPLVAADLNGIHWYGPLSAASQAPMFLMMPAGAWLLSRFRIGHLMLFFTMVTVGGAVLCAVAPAMWVFVTGTAVRAFASGALATVGMGAISRGLPPKWRQLVLAGISGIWVFSSVLGPVYAVAASQWLGWRWAMLLYLPALLVARTMIARYMPERTKKAAREKAPWGWSLMLAAGSAVLALPLGSWSVVLLVIGGGLMMWAAAVILPAGSFSASRGRRTALGALSVTAGFYFGASIVLSVVAHDAFGIGAGQFGFIIAAPGFMWAAAGLWTGSHPADGDRALRRRLIPAGGTIALGVVVIFMTTLLVRGTSAFGGLLGGAALLGLGMGSLYPGLLGRCLSEPATDDGIAQDRMAATGNSVDSKRGTTPRRPRHEPDAPDGTHKNRAESPPRRSAPTPTSAMPGPPGRTSRRSPADATCRRSWGSPVPAPAEAGNFDHAKPTEARRGTPRHRPRPRWTTQSHRPPQPSWHPCYPAPDPTPATETPDRPPN